MLHNLADPKHGLIYGLDPINPAHAEIIVSQCHGAPRLKRALAWRTLMNARGKSCDMRNLRNSMIAQSATDARGDLRDTSIGGAA